MSVAWCSHLCKPLTHSMRINNSVACCKVNTNKPKHCNNVCACQFYSISAPSNHWLMCSEFCFCSFSFSSADCGYDFLPQYCKVISIPPLYQNILWFKANNEVPGHDMIIQMPLMPTDGPKGERNGAGMHLATAVIY